MYYTGQSDATFEATARPVNIATARHLGLRGRKQPRRSNNGSQNPNLRHWVPSDEFWLGLLPSDSKSEYLICATMRNLGFADWQIGSCCA